MHYFTIFACQEPPRIFKYIYMPRYSCIILLYLYAKNYLRYFSIYIPKYPCNIVIGILEHRYIQLLTVIGLHLGYIVLQFCYYLIHHLYTYIYQSKYRASIEAANSLAIESIKLSKLYLFLFIVSFCFSSASNLIPIYNCTSTYL